MKREVSHQEGKNFAKLYGCPFVECSAKTGENIELPFQFAIEKIEKTKNKGITKHSWKKIYFSSPPVCTYCKTTIWGIIFQYGFYCEDCGYSCHRACLENVPLYCDPSKKIRPVVSTLASIRSSESEIVAQVTHGEMNSVFEDENLFHSLYTFTKSSQMSVLHLEIYKSLKEYEKILDPVQKKQNLKHIIGKFKKSNSNIHFLLLFIFKN